ncbi:hypothetical protein FQA39_LY18095 [Lamprigera yunnana]|nr:hypothetical protein FQA39_LY18095 [Lamprigera yunnana]
MDQSMEKIQRQFKTIQKRIHEKREKKDVEEDCKMVEIKEQVDNSSGQINGIFERLREQENNVEAKINQDKEERIQVCEDLKEQNRAIVNYIEEKIKIGNGTGHNVITNYRKIEKEAPKFHPSKNEHPKTYVQELQTYLKVIKKQIRNQYDESMEDAIMKEAIRGETETWYRTEVGEYRNFKQFWNGFTKNYWGRMEESENRRWNDYGNRQRVITYRYREQTREGRYEGIFKRYENENENNGSGGRNVNINHIVQQPKEEEDRIERVYMMSGEIETIPVWKFYGKKSKVSIIHTVQNPNNLDLEEIDIWDEDLKTLFELPNSKLDNEELESNVSSSNSDREYEVPLHHLASKYKKVQHTQNPIIRESENDNPNRGNGIKEEMCDKDKYSIRNNGLIMRKQYNQ